MWHVANDMRHVAGDADLATHLTLLRDALGLELVCELLELARGARTARFLRLYLRLQLSHSLFRLGERCTHLLQLRLSRHPLVLGLLRGVERAEALASLTVHVRAQPVRCVLLFLRP